MHAHTYMHTHTHIHTYNSFSKLFIHRCYKYWHSLTFHFTPSSPSSWQSCLTQNVSHWMNDEYFNTYFTIHAQHSLSPCLQIHCLSFPSYYQETERSMIIWKSQPCIDFICFIQLILVCFKEKCEILKCPLKKNKKNSSSSWWITMRKICSKMNLEIIKNVKFFPWPKRHTAALQIHFNQFLEICFFPLSFLP